MDHINSLEELSDKLMYNINNDSLTNSEKYLECLKYFEIMTSISYSMDGFDLNDFVNIDKNDPTLLMETCYSISARITAIKFIATLPKKDKNIIIEEIKLDDNWKTRVRSYISIIKSEVDSSELLIEIRSSIMKKLLSFELEIEKEITNLQSFNYAIMDITYAIGIGCDNLKKPFDLLHKLLKGFAKLHSIEYPSLPSPEETKLLPPPE